MIQQILGPVLEQAGKALANGASSLGKAIAEHFAKHWRKYATGGGVVAVGGASYAVGKSHGHTQGKKEGTAEQATRDKKKMEELQKQHEDDRRKWQKIDKKKDELIDDLSRNL